MKYARWVAVLLLAALAVTVGCGPSAEDREAQAAVLESLTRLESRTEVGIVYVDYLEAVGTTKGDVDVFLESDHAESDPEFSAAVDMTMTAYMEAATFWKYEIDDVRVDTESVDAWDRLVEKYPLLTDATSDKSGSADDVDPRVAVQALWAGASESIQEARSLTDD